MKTKENISVCLECTKTYATELSKIPWKHPKLIPTCLLEILRRLVRKALSFCTLSLVLILDNIAAVFCSDLGCCCCCCGRIAGCMGIGWF